MPYIGNRKKRVKSYIPSMFQTSDTQQLLSPKKLKFNIHLSKSHKRDHIYKLCLYMLGKHICLILKSKAESRNIAPMLENNNLSYIAENHSSVTLLKHFVYRWHTYITAEF